MRLSTSLPPGNRFGWWMLTCIAIAASPPAAIAQTASAIRQTAAPAAAGETPRGLPMERQPAGPSVINPWVLGTQLGTQFYGDEGLNDDLLVGAKFVYPVVTGTKWEVATFGNFASFVDEFDPSDEEKREEAVSNLLTSSRGLLVGAQVYRRVAVPKQNWLQVVPFGQVDIRLSRAKSTDTASAGDADDERKAANVLQRRAGFGIEAHIGNQGADHRPLTLSFSRTRTWADSTEFADVFGDRRLPRYVNEYTAIFPISKRFGIVGEMARGERDREVYRVSLLVVTGGGDQTPDEEGDPEGQGETAKLTIRASEAGVGGTIVATWDPDGRASDCVIPAGGSCELVLPLKKRITLTATANGSSTLSKWSPLAPCMERQGESDHTGPVCTITIERALDPFAAPFAPKQP